MKRKLASCAILLIAGQVQAEFYARGLNSDEWVQFSPTTARALGPGQWQVDIRSWVYEKEPRLGYQSAFADYMDLNLDALPPAERAEYLRRTRLLLTDSESQKTFTVTFPNTQLINTEVSNMQGVSSTRANVELPDSTSRIRYVAQTHNGEVQGTALMLSDRGISIISDIDDTIKDSQVLNRPELLRNALIRPHRAVDGMAAHYQRYSKESKLFVHYVSNSPLGFQPLVLEFLSQGKFPEGTLHLRPFEIQATVLAHLGDIFSESETGGHKRTEIRTLVTDFPQRRFVLIGDTGEQDPEIYAAMMREFPKQIRCIWLRNVSQQSLTDARMIAVQKALPKDAVRLFTNAKTLPEKAKHLCKHP